MKKTLSILIILCFCLASVFAFESVYNLFPLLSENQVKTLVSGETLENSTLADGIVQLAPANTLAYEQASKPINAKKSFSVGIVSFVPYPTSWQGLTDEEKQLKVFNILTSISTQEGITYISRTAGYKEKTLMEESYCISNSNKKNSRIDDPVFDSVPESFSMYSFQKDNRFGGNVFKLDYQNSSSEVFLSIVNQTAMKFMGISCVPKEKLSMFIDTCLTNEGIVVFSMATIVDKEPEVHLVVYTVDLESSFQRRITGFKNWFVSMV